MKSKLPANAFWRVGVFRLTVVVGLLFYVLTTVAMLVYPGGTISNHHTRGYDFFTNFLSDLGRSVTPSGQVNLTSMVLFIVALSAGAIAIALFFIAFTQLFTFSRLNVWFSRVGAICGLLASICFVGVAAVPENLATGLHNAFIYIALVAFLAAFLLIFLAVVRKPGLPRRILWVFIAFGIVLVAYVLVDLWVLFFGPAQGTLSWEIIQATGQKIIVYAAILTALVQSLNLPPVLRKGVKPASAL